jgi:DNA-binding beta-propeller fold protein YncE
VLAYDHDQLPPLAADELKRMRDSALTGDFSARIRRWLGEPGSEDYRLELDDPGQLEQTCRALADEAWREKALLEREWSWLASTGAQRFWAFFVRLGELDAELEYTTRLESVLGAEKLEERPTPQWSAALEGHRRAGRGAWAWQRIEALAGNGTKGFPEDGGLAKAQPLINPQGLAIHGGSLWIASVGGHVVWRLNLTSGVIQRVAGTGRQGYSGDGGEALQATFDGPRGVAMSPAGILYVVEGENNIIRAFDTVGGSIWTIAGAGPKQHAYAGDGTAAVGAPLWQPHGICLSPDGSLVLSDTINHRVRTLLPEK